MTVVPLPNAARVSLVVLGLIALVTLAVSAWFISFGSLPGVAAGFGLLALFGLRPNRLRELLGKAGIIGWALVSLTFLAGSARTLAAECSRLGATMLWPICLLVVGLAVIAHQIRKHWHGIHSEAA